MPVEHHMASSALCWGSIEYGLNLSVIQFLSWGGYSWTFKILEPLGYPMQVLLHYSG